MPGSSLTYAIADPVSPLFFNSIPPANFNATTDTIDLGTTHNFGTGDCIWFYPSNQFALTVLGGISPYTKYFVIVVNTTSIKLATTLINATSSVALDISVPASSLNFTKGGAFAGLGTSLSTAFVLPESYPAYAKSNTIFNSSTPVEITFTIPAWSSSPVNSSIIQVLLRQVNQSGYYGLLVYNRDGGNVYVFSGSTYGVMGTGFFIIFSGFSTSTGYTQKYIINTNRQIECWIGRFSNALTLYYTTPALGANIPLVLEFGSSFSIAKVQDCTIKYL
jgi:hypothetical protein